MMVELEVLNPRGLPQKAVISISVGGTRRNIPLSGLDRPLRFPGKAEDVSQIKVDVLNVMGSCRLPYEPSVEKYTVPLEAVNTEIMQNQAPDSMELDLIVRCCDPENGCVSPTQEEADAIRKKREAGASDYLEQHGLVNYIQFLLTSLMQEKPTDPYRFLQKQITKQIESKALASELAGVDARLSPTSAVKCPVEDFEKNEKETIKAAQELRSDNASLHETALQLQNEYESLVKESYTLQGQLGVKSALKESEAHPTVLPFDRYYNRFVGRQCGGTCWNSLYAQFDSYRPAIPVLGENSAEVQTLQEECGYLARENAKLAADLARGREMIETIRSDILEIRRTVHPEQ